MSARCQKRTLAWKFGTLREQLLERPAERRALPPLSSAACGLDESAPKQIGVQLIERGRSLRTGKSVRVIRLWVFQLCP
jgi:hypothetical protein